MNWKKTNGNLVEESVAMSIKDFRKLERQAVIGHKICLLNESAKSVVLQLLEELLECSHV